MHVEFFVKLVYPAMTEEHQIGRCSDFASQKIEN